MASSSSLDLFEYMPTPKIIKTASTSLPSSSSSASPPNLKWTYDVFLSFRGEDTRNNFVDHLFMHLKQKGINTFRDEKLERGEKISDNLLKAIEESRFAIIIFSENYASSSWCLDELVKIIACMKETGQIVYPVFYNVDPSNVRDQKESFAKAFDEHEKKNLASGKMEKWKKALSRTGIIAGWDTRDRPEAEIIQKIVDEIFYKLNRGLLRVDDNLVGMEIHINEINTCLNTGSNEVIFVGIYGLGGIGKTTIAKVIYNQISHQFEGCSYLANIRATYEKERNLVSLQNQLFRDILKDRNLQTCDDDSGSYVIEERLNNKKVLIILDDVDHENQLDKLAENGEWFGPGSRIIITTRDQHLLSKYEEVQRYEVRECDSNKSLEIFSWKAFKKNHPPEDYMKLSNDVVRYTKGLPLALTILGSHLRKKGKDAWRGAIAQLSVVPNREINDILKISYEGLEELQKDVFLDIACFFNGEDKDKVMEKLHSFGFFPSINIQVLIDKSLITVSNKNELMMHDLVRDMGRHIVHQESPKNPGKRSRLWNTEDIRRVVEKNMATEAIEGIQPETFMYDWSFKDEAFIEMKNLRFFGWPYYRSEHLAFDFPHDKLVHLSLIGSTIKLLWNGRKVLPHLKSIDLTWCVYLREFPDVTGLSNLERLSLYHCEELVEIHPFVWVHKGLKFLDLRYCYNLRSYPNKIQMESLVELDLPLSKDLREFPDVSGLPNLERLSLSECFDLVKIDRSVWVHKGLKFLDLYGCYNLGSFPNKIEMESLVVLNLTFSEHLREFPDVTGVPNLERLSLYHCQELVEIHPSVWVHKGLKFLDLRYCYNLGSFLSKIEMESLETLHLTCCYDMMEFPEVHGNMKRLSELVLSETAIKELPSSIENFTALNTLDLEGCRNLVCLPSSICKLKYLEELNLHCCSNLDKLPENIGELESLVKLDASRTAIKEVPASIQFLVKLRNLDFGYCRGLKLPSFYGLSSLTELDLSGCDLTDETFPNNIECLSSLETLDLSDNNFVSLPADISKLPLLTQLKL